VATAAKKTAARRAPALPVPEPERAVPLVVLKRRRGAENEPLDRVLLFTREWDDGETQEFWIPKRRMASLALKYMKMSRVNGEDAATAWALEEVLGTPAYDSLMEDSQLEETELIQIFGIVQDAIMGAVSDPKEDRG